MRTEIGRGLQLDDFSQMAESPAFGVCVQKLGRYTIKQRMEGGFAAYQKPGSAAKPKLSRVIRPTHAELQQTAEDSFGSISEILENTIDASTGEGIAFDFNPLILDELCENRRDIAFLVHSHPGGSRFLRPAGNDLEIHQEQTVVNPGVITSVLTADKTTGQASLLAYRASDHRDLQPGLVYSLGWRSSVQTVLETMHDAGLNTVQLDYNLDSARLLTDISAIDELYR